MKVTFNCKPYVDRRSLSLCQHHDELVEQEWRRRVANNPTERRRLEREQWPQQPLYVIQTPELLRPQAE